MRRPLLIVFSSVVVGAVGLAQQAPDRDVTDAFEVPPGQRVTLWADSPQVYNPTALDVDVRGRLWVTEAVNYRKWGGRNAGRDHPKGDRVVILEDTDGDGVCDSSKVFAQDEDLVAPLGIAVIGDRVLVSCSPHLFVYRDTDGDDVADQREKFLTGFGGFNHDHGLHSIVGGPDGTLYFNAGNAGPHQVTDAAGWSLRSGSIYTGGGPEPAPNRPGLISDDGRAWTGGIVMRVGADGRGLGVVAHNFRNPYEVAVDSFGDLWQSDNDDDGNASCRTMWVMPGGDFGFFSADGARRWQADRRPEQPTPRAHWHADDPGVAPPGCINGGGGPTGVAVYEDGYLAAEFEGAVLNCDAGASVVYAHRPKRVGAGWELERGDLLRSKPGEKAKWFRPSDVVVGSEGAIYVADWWDPGVGGHAAGDREAYGRILRIAPTNAPQRMASMTIDSAQSAVAALTNPALHVRQSAQQWLLAHPSEAARSKLGYLFERSLSVRIRARAMFVLARLGDTAAIATALASDDPRLRVAALRATPQRAPEFVGDESPLVRREVAYLIRDLPAAERLPLLERLAATYPAGDRFYLETLGDAARGHADDLYVRLVAKQHANPRKWDVAFAEIVWRLHPESAIPALMSRIMAPELARSSRVQAIAALAFIESRRAAESMLAVAEAGPEDTKSLAFWWCTHRDNNDWARHGLGAKLGGERAAAERLFASGVVQAGARQIEVALGAARTLWLVVTDGGDGNSCDWADWIDPEFVGPAGRVSLFEHGWVRAIVGWGQLGRDKNAGGGPLAIGERSFARGIGVHANSEIMVRVPEGYDTFRATIGPDLGGTSQSNGRSTSIEFEVFGAAPKSTAVAVDPQLTRWVETLTTADNARAVRLRAATKLAGNAAGGAMLVNLAAAEKLDTDARELVAQSIFSTPDPTVRALASVYFDRPGRVGAPLPPIAELAQLAGDRTRGAELFAGRAGCAACHVAYGRGGAIGPELTRIRDKLGATGLVDAMLNPSAAIAFGYDAWVIELQDDRVLSGYILADGANLVIEDLAGERVVVAAEQVRRRTEQKISVMPSVAALGLSAQQIADLTAYLLTDAFSDMQFGEELELFNGADLAGWDVVASDGAWSVTDGVLRCVGQPIGYIQTRRDFTNYVLSVEWRTPPGGRPGNSGVLLRKTGADSVWPNSIEAQLHSGNAGDIWNIGKFPMDVAAERTNGRRTIKAHASSERPLGEWNQYEIIMRGGDLRLTVNGVVQNEATHCAERAGRICLQSEGAPIEFRNIRLRPILD